MKKKSNGMSPDMFHDAMSSTPIPVFTSANNEDKNSASEMSKVPEVSLDDNHIQTELIKVDFDKQTVSARALHHFFELAERFSIWCKRMFSYGLIENRDFTAVGFHTAVNNGRKQEIGDYLLTIDAAKHIAMVQRNEKGKQARDYFINVEKLYLNKVYSTNPNSVTSVTPFEKIRNALVEIESEMLQQNDSKLWAEKTLALVEKKLAEQTALYNLKDKYMEHSISKKIDKAVKDSFREAEQFRNGEEGLNRLPRATNQNSVVALNQLEKNLQKTTLEEDLIQKYFRPADRKTDNAIFWTATEITHQLEWHSKRVTVRNVGRALRKLGFERLNYSIDEKRAKGYYVIQL